MGRGRMSRRRRRRRRRGKQTEGLAGLTLPRGSVIHPTALPPAPDPLAAAERRAEAASTWWSRRWLQALDAFGGLGTLGRGQGQSRREQVLAIHIEPGIVLAQVQSLKPEPHIVRIDVPPLPPETWEEAVAFMAQRAVFAAKLLAGEMPESIEEAFAEAGSALLPQAGSDVPSTCTCGEPGTPCKHVAAVHYLLADEFGRDPFLIFKLRGQTKEQLLHALRVRRTGAAMAGEPEAPPADEAAVEAVSPQAFWHGGDAIREFTINIAPPLTHAALLRQLGVPPIEGGEAFVDVMSALYRRIMESVLEEALRGQRPAPPPATPPPAGPQAAAGGRAVEGSANLDPRQE